MNRRPILAVLALAALIGAASCSSDETRSIGGPPGSTTVEVSVSSSSSSAPTTAEPTTTAPPSAAPTAAPTTAATTTAAPTTVAPLAGWTPYDASGLTAPMAMPCCGSTWYATTPSPALPAPGEPLADGDYRVEGTWSANPSDPLQLTVRRYELCATLAPGDCEMEPPYGPTDFGVDRSSSYPLSLPLDEHLQVLLTGITTDDVDPDSTWTGLTASATGADLGALAGAVDQAYEADIGVRIRAGEDPNAVLADVAANPVNGWAPAPEGSGALTFNFASAPPLLFQTYLDRGADAIGLISLHVEGAVVMLITYAGFYS